MTSSSDNDKGGSCAKVGKERAAGEMMDDDDDNDDGDFDGGGVGDDDADGDCVDCVDESVSVAGAGEAARLRRPACTRARNST